MYIQAVRGIWEDIKYDELVKVVIPACPESAVFCDILKKKDSGQANSRSDGAAGMTVSRCYKAIYKHSNYD